MSIFKSRIVFFQKGRDDFNSFVDAFIPARSSDPQVCNFGGSQDHLLGGLMTLPPISWLERSPTKSTSCNVRLHPWGQEEVSFALHAID